MLDKPQRIVDPVAVQRVRDRGRCELQGVGECWGGLDIHHIKTRGSGGDDVEENMALLCRHHHDLMGARKISVETLRERQKWWQRFDRPLR